MKPFGFDAVGWPAPFWFGTSAVALGVVASLKLVVGETLTTAPLYLLPVLACSWYATRGWAYATAGLSALVSPVLHGWVLRDATLDQAIANGALLSIAAGTVTWLVSRFRQEYDERVRAEQALEAAMAHRRAVRGDHLLCPDCVSVRADSGEWVALARWVSRTTSASFSHKVCPACAGRERPSTT